MEIVHLPFLNNGVRPIPLGYAPCIRSVFISKNSLVWAWRAASTLSVAALFCSLAAKEKKHDQCAATFW